MYLSWKTGTSSLIARTYVLIKEKSKPKCDYWTREIDGQIKLIRPQRNKVVREKEEDLDLLN